MFDSFRVVFYWLIHSSLVYSLGFWMFRPMDGVAFLLPSVLTDGRLAWILGQLSGHPGTALAYEFKGGVPNDSRVLEGLRSMRPWVVDCSRQLPSKAEFSFFWSQKPFVQTLVLAKIACGMWVGPLSLRVKPKHGGLLF